MVSDWTSCTSNRILKLDTHDNATKGQNTHYCWVHCPQNIRKRNTQFKHTCPTAYWCAYAELAAPQTMMVGQCLSKVIIWFYSIGDVVDSMFVFSSLMHFKDCYTAVKRKKIVCNIIGVLVYEYRNNILKGTRWYEKICILENNPCWTKTTKYIVKDVVVSLRQLDIKW